MYSYNSTYRIGRAVVSPVAKGAVAMHVRVWSLNSEALCDGSRLAATDSLDYALRMLFSYCYYLRVSVIISGAKFLCFHYVDQQTLKPDDDYVCLALIISGRSNRRILVGPLWETERFLLQPIVCEWNRLPSHVTAAPALSIFCCRLKSHLFSLSYPAVWLFSHL